jgi:hypothetical protein
VHTCQAAAQAALAKLAAVQAQVRALAADNSVRQSSIASKVAQLSTAQLSVAPLVLPQELRAHQMAALHARCVCMQPIHAGKHYLT